MQTSKKNIICYYDLFLDIAGNQIYTIIIYYDAVFDMMGNSNGQKVWRVSNVLLKYVAS